MGGVPLLLAGCAPPQQEPALLYEDAQQCIADGQVPTADCEEGYQRSLAAQEDAPRYNSLEECEAEYGEQHCRPAQGSWFVPMATGFLIARALDHPGYGYTSGPYTGGWAGAASWYSEPVYRVRGGRDEWRTLSGERFGASARGPGAYTVAETLSRGGFGRASAARFSWGG